MFNSGNNTITNEDGDDDDDDNDENDSRCRDN